MIHKLKCFSVYYELIVSGYKRFEYRLNDRDFKVDDTLILEEIDPYSKKYTNRSVSVKVLYVFKGYDFDSFPMGYVIMSISDPLGLSGVRNQDNLESF